MPGGTPALRFSGVRPKICTHKHGVAPKICTHEHGVEPKICTHDPGGDMVNAWATVLLDCDADERSCCLGCWCPCILAGENIEMISDGATSKCQACCCYSLLILACNTPFLYTCRYRKRLREKYGLPEEPCEDWATHCCCMLCALCQENRELQNRGLDPSIGFAANQEKNPPLQTMKR